MKLCNKNLEKFKRYPEIEYNIKYNKEIPANIFRLRTFGFKIHDIIEYAELSVKKYFECLIKNDSAALRNTVSYNAYYTSEVIKRDNILSELLLNGCTVEVGNASLFGCVKIERWAYIIYTSIDIKIKGSEGKQYSDTVVAKFMHKMTKDLTVYKDAMLKECPICRSSIDVDLNGNCSHCGGKLSFGDNCWLLDDIIFPKEIRK